MHHINFHYSTAGHHFFCEVGFFLGGGKGDKKKAMFLYGLILFTKKGCLVGQWVQRGQDRLPEGFHSAPIF